MRLAFQNEIALIALAGAAPATLVAAWFAWRHAPTPELAVVCVVALLILWAGCALAIRRRLVFSLQTLANLVEAVRLGDYTLRGRRAREGDALGEVVQEVNALGDALQSRRLASLEATALVQTVVEELETAVLTFDEQGKLRLVNRAAAELLGRSAESLVGLGARELGLAELLERETNGVVSLAFPARAGRFEVHRRSFREGGLPHTLLMLADVSRSLREEERRAWQRLIRVVGHEINNSLTPIKSIATTLRDVLARSDGPSDGGTPELLDGLSLIADRADSLSKFVAAYSQLARLPPPSKCPVSLNALLQRLVTAGPFAGIRIGAPFEVSVQADPGQLEQALINLLKNAVEATGGDPGAVEIVLARTRVAASIEIRDEGPGIANPDNLFVPFFTTKPGGSGIGLALSRQIVEGHGGTLTLENRTDRTGGVARVLLPV